ncbi:hypothetical protein NO2_1049 [Candidatus Termititenax persephonae]|uniref:Outer membrane protein n=1 Tax=Candidatus Termititenax persephonae TaxID=2218525 RepID=A0A388THA8_9BACT|nr:hypothetical protein NO2_1049 [Candidatus Termititenax persephonae]
MTKQKLYIILLFAACLHGEAKQAYGFDTVIHGADAAARGGTYLGANGTTQPIFQNYAFLSQRAQPQAALSVFKLLNEVNYLTAAYTHGHFSLGVLSVQDSLGYLRDAQNNSRGRIGYSDTTLYAAYGLGGRKLSGGWRLKYNSKTYSEVGASAQALSADLAASYRPHRLWTFGAQANNLLGGELRWSTGQVEELTKTYGLGGKYQAAPNLDLYTDIRLEKNQPPLFSCGVEYNLARRVFLRGGFRQNNDLILNTNFSAGLGFRWQGLSLDYAYNPDPDLGGNASHFVTLGWEL